MIVCLAVKYTTGWIQPDRPPAFLVIRIHLGARIVILWPNNGVVFVAEIFKALGQGLIRQSLRVRLMRQKFLQVILAWFALATTGAHAPQKGLATALAVKQLELQW